MSSREPSVNEKRVAYLLFLDVLDRPATDDMIWRYALGIEGTTYFTHIEALLDLEEKKLIRKAADRNKNVYMLTPTGRETLSIFRGMVRPSLREMADKVSEEITTYLREADSVHAEIMGKDSDSIMVQCTVHDDGISLLSFVMHASDMAEAQMIKSYWTQHGADVYARLIRSIGQED